MHKQENYTIYYADNISKIIQAQSFFEAAKLFAEWFDWEDHGHVSEYIIEIENEYSDRQKIIIIVEIKKIFHVAHYK